MQRTRYKVVRGELVQLTDEELARELERETGQVAQATTVDLSMAVVVNAGAAPAALPTGQYI